MHLFGRLILILAIIDTLAVASLKAQSLTNFGGGTSDALGLNDSDQVVGYYGSEAFLYSDGTLTNLGTLGGNVAVAQSINDSGQIVGYSNTSSYQTDAFLYSNGTMTDLGNLGGTSIANRINNSGQVVGY